MIREVCWQVWFPTCWKSDFQPRRIIWIHSVSSRVCFVIERHLKTSREVSPVGRPCSANAGSLVKSVMPFKLECPSLDLPVYLFLLLPSCPVLLVMVLLKSSSTLSINILSLSASPHPPLSSSHPLIFLFPMILRSMTRAFYDASRILFMQIHSNKSPSPCFPSPWFRRSLVFPVSPGGGWAVGARILGALLPGNAWGGGPGLVHPVAWPQQPGNGAAAAAAQQPVRQRSPQPGGSGGESQMCLVSQIVLFF